MSDEYRAEVAKHCRKRKYSAAYTRFWLGHLRCVVCGKNSAAPHHIRSRGAGGDDTAANLLPLCTDCHTAIHQLGAETFGERNPVVARKIAAALDRSRERSHNGA